VTQEVSIGGRMEILGPVRRALGGLKLPGKPLMVLGSFRLVPGTSKLPGNPMMIPGPSLLSISLTDTNISLTDYVRLVRTNGNAGSSGDVLRICPHLIS
jgi:hypothetical protein